MRDATTFPELANELLKCDGKIFLAYDAQQAFQLMEHFGGAVALIDLDSRGGEGIALMRNSRKKFPELRIVAISRVLGVP
ncbi:MAG: hypothetical protein WDO73_11595 [Ignavibacteriota bacterium]